jgi:hypothetical protein
LISKSLMEAKDYAAIESATKAVMEIIKAVRG